MISKTLTFIRDRWHPLWRLRRWGVYRDFQRRFDRTVDVRIPGTGLRVAVKLMRDASWIVNPEALEPEIFGAFALALDLFKPATFWDAGANIGFYSWIARKHPAVRQVVMAEPDPVNYSLIMRTIARNGIADCEAMNLALGDREGEAVFLADGVSGAAGSLASVAHPEEDWNLQNAYGLKEKITCRMATVDGLIGEGLPAPDMMKIDVEGAEHLVIEGARQCIAARRPVLIIETANAELIRELAGSGYAAFRIDAENLLFVPEGDGVDTSVLTHAFPREAEG
jgi:FkbM family methyltransferase